MNALDRTKKALGGHGSIARVASACGKSHQAVRKWFAQGVLPATEITEIGGRRQTSYGLIIESLTQGAVTDRELRDENLEFRRSDKAA
tara:strand:- start:7094 stop:7357 length:264 start_codon:yes stop_codon:yes gene_type:complete